MVSGQDLLAAYGALNTVLRKQTYASGDKARIVSLLATLGLGAGLRFGVPLRWLMPLFAAAYGAVLLLAFMAASRGALDGRSLGVGACASKRPVARADGSMRRSARLYLRSGGCGTPGS